MKKKALLVIAVTLAAIGLLIATLAAYTVKVEEERNPADDPSNCPQGGGEGGSDATCYHIRYCEYDCDTSPPELEKCWWKYEWK